MKVLMLGWEFPPHISGGLGTACYGITQGLAAHQVQVLFVVPRAFGDEPSVNCEIVGASSVPLTFNRGSAAAEGSTTVVAGVVGDTVQDQTFSDESTFAASLAPLIELLAIDSPLRPYMTAASYTRAVVRPSERRSAASMAQMRQTLLAASSMGTIPLAEDVAAVLGAVADSGSDTVHLSFSGGYGESLLEEVARYAVVVSEIARTREFDVVHVHDWLTVPAGIVAARSSGKPLVVHIHACEYDRSGDNPNQQVRDIEQLALNEANRVICVSHFTASLLRRRYHVDPDKLRVVHNAVQREQQARDWHVARSIPEPLVLFLGRVTYQKGPDYFLEAAARVVQIDPKVRFVMSGSGDLLPSMIEHAARLGLARNVYFTGFLRGKDVERMYAMADIYVMPSVSEPFGISPLEALAFDVPVIVSRQSGVQEILRNSLKVDFWDTADLANKILALLRYPSLRAQVVEDGKEEIRRLRWDVQGGIVADIYRELVA